jgi:dTDP-4-dehydrorhamnose 3,5-epimerase
MSHYGVVDVVSDLSAAKDRPHAAVTHTITRGHIDGVQLVRSTPAIGRTGITIEAWRHSWELGLGSIDQFNVVNLAAGAVSAWHLHQRRCDGVLVVAGELRLVLFDARPGSATQGSVDVVTASSSVPTLVVIPPFVWHGVQVLGNEPASFVNCFDQSYDPDDPDEWRLPVDSDEVPYRFK